MPEPVLKAIHLTYFSVDVLRKFSLLMEQRFNKLITSTQEKQTSLDGDFSDLRQALSGVQSSLTADIRQRTERLQSDCDTKLSDLKSYLVDQRAQKQISETKKMKAWCDARVDEKLHVQKKSFAEMCEQQVADLRVSIFDLPVP